MSSKNIALREDVYKKLKEVKGPDESFSDAIEDLLEMHKLRKLILLGRNQSFQSKNSILCKKAAGGI